MTENCETIGDCKEEAIKFIAAMRVIEDIYHDKEELEVASDTIMSFVDWDLPDDFMKILQEGVNLGEKESDKYLKVWKYLKNRAIINIRKVKGFKKTHSPLEDFEKKFCVDIKNKIKEFWRVGKEECNNN